MEVNKHTLSRYAAHVSLKQTIGHHSAPALSIMMIFTELCIDSTLHEYEKQGWAIAQRSSGMVFRDFVAKHISGAEIEISPRDYIGRYNRLLPLEPIAKGITI